MIWFTEPLEVDDFAFSQELEGVADIGVVDEPQQIFVGGSRFLFGGEVFKQVGDRIAFDLQPICREWGTACRLRIDARSMVDKIGVKAAVADLLGGQVAGQLIQNRCNHLLMCQFFCPYI